jgi:hypothetical protein
VRALEGELARTIQLMRGVKAAGAHIVMADEVPRHNLRLWWSREKNNFNDTFPLTLNHKLLTVNE